MITKITAGMRTLHEVVRLVWSEATPFVKSRLALTLSLLLVTSVLTALGPLALKLTVDRLMGNATGAAVPLTLLIALYVFSQWLARTVAEARLFIYARAERRMFRTLGERVFAHVMRLPYRFHLERRTGAISQTLENGLHGFRLALHHLVFTLLPVLAELGTILVVLASVDQPVFLWLFVAAIFCYAIAFTITAYAVAEPARAASSAHIDATAVMTDGILNYETVKYFAAEAAMQARVRRALTRTEEEWVHFFKRYAVSGVGVGTIFSAFLAVATLYAATQVQAGLMTIGAFVLINSYMLRVIQPVEMLGYAMQHLSQAVAMLERLLELLGERRESDDACVSPSGRGLGQLDFENVHLSYGPDRSVLKGVSFKVGPGGTLGIVGMSGAGKSTLVRLLVRLLDPDSGHILLGGVPITELSLLTLRRAVAVVPQDTVLFNESIGYNIALGKPDSSQTEIEEAARLAHLHDFISSLPEKYGTMVGERGIKLSGGERQRISIARAALKHPQIYVFDEATSSLDSSTEREILRNLREIARSSTTLVIAHRLSTVVYADEIIVLENGVIVERGTHSSLLAQAGRYATLWHAQQHAAAFSHGCPSYRLTR